MCGVQKITWRSHFSPSTSWVSGLKLSSSDIKEVPTGLSHWRKALKLLPLTWCLFFPALHMKSAPVDSVHIFARTRILWRRQCSVAYLNVWGLKVEAQWGRVKGLIFRYFPLPYPAHILKMNSFSCFSFFFFFVSFLKNSKWMSKQRK